MKISSKGRYALRMMIEIARRRSGEWVSLKDISQHQGISVKYLEQIVSHLTATGLLLSSRGAQGGYQLAKTPDHYTAGQILRAMEGSLAPVACLDTDNNTCERRECCTTLAFWEGLDKVIREYVDGVTLQDLVSSCETNDGDDFCI